MENSEVASSSHIIDNIKSIILLNIKHGLYNNFNEYMKKFKLGGSESPSHRKYSNSEVASPKL
jgi:hypothetical protein